MNTLYLGLHKRIERPKGWWLWIVDEVPDIPTALKAKVRIFDPLKHHFNPLEKLDYKKATEIVQLLLALNPAGGSTLTKEDAAFLLLEALLKSPKSLVGLIEESKDPKREAARRMVDRLFMSPILQRVFDTTEGGFSFKGPNTKIFARINRAELAEYDARALAWFLLAQFKGQTIVPEFDFYGRDFHTSLIWEKRLIAGVNYLDALHTKELRQAVLLMEEKIGSGTTVKDAQELAGYENLRPGVNKYNDFVERTIS
jgi:hypothetical protein